MPALCSLLLEVFMPPTLEGVSNTIDWEVSTDPDHPTPYLLGPRNYAEQEIDPIQCTASIGTVEVGVIDPPQSSGQTTGWMTERVHGLLGRRCRLRRYVSADIGWVTIADGPAGSPKMDKSYAAYRWAIRDTRETERKLPAFLTGGVASIVPRGAIYGFGRYTDDSDYESIELSLLPRILDAPIAAKYQLSPAGDLILGIANLAQHFSPGAGPVPNVDNALLVMDESAVQAVQITQYTNGKWVARNADVLWRLVGETDWNVARMAAPSDFPQPFLGTADALVAGSDDVILAANYVTLFVEEAIPAGFPSDTEVDIEIIVRYRGPATDDFPYYLEGPLGEILRKVYDGEYTLPPIDEIGGELYDPAELDSGQAFATRIRYDADALAAIETPVLFRQVQPVSDVRAWAETALYSPSGHVPALNDTLEISPISRSVRNFVDRLVDDDVTVPNTSWQQGERTVSQIIYTYPRYFIPTDDTIETKADGLAQRDVKMEFRDPESEIRYGQQIEEYDASAFAAIGDEDGTNRPGVLETANLLCQNAKFDVLDRYRAGAQSIMVNVKRARLPFVRVGDWVPWSLMHLPSRTTNLRGSNAEAAQILSIRDDDCMWRTLLLEESGFAAGAPGYLTDLSVAGTESSIGTSTLIVVSDVESP